MIACLAELPLDRITYISARIWSPRWGVHDVADGEVEVRRGRVIWSVSVTIPAVGLSLS